MHAWTYTHTLHCCACPTLAAACIGAGGALRVADLVRLLPPNQQGLARLPAIPCVQTNIQLAHAHIHSASQSRTRPLLTNHDEHINLNCNRYHNGIHQQCACCLRPRCTCFRRMCWRAAVLVVWAKQTKAAWVKRTPHPYTVHTYTQHRAPSPRPYATELSARTLPSNLHGNVW